MPSATKQPETQQSGDWRMGYRTDVEYTFGLYPVLNPDNLMLTAALRGVRPPAEVVARADGRRSLTYCELGCGQGISVNLMAARDPAGRYVGVDYNPAQIRNARRLAERAGLTNLTLIEDSFENLDQHDLPEFDIVVLHGIYSWVSPEVRASIVRFIRRKLKAGGLCYVSYNCTVGRGADQAMRELLRAARPLQAGTPLEQAAGALTMVQDIAKADSRYFALHKSTAQHLTQLGKHRPSYIVHEYMNDYWQPFFFSEVMRDMDGAKLSFVGQTDLIANRPDLCLTAQGQAMHDRMTRLEDRELVKDIWVNQPFRSDLYVKGASPLTLTQQAAALADVPFRLTRPRAQCKLQVQVAAGTANLPPSPFDKVLDALATGIRTGAELRPLFDEWGDDVDFRFVRAIEVLCAVRYIQLAVHPDLQATLRQRFEGLDAAIAGLVDEGMDLYLAPSPANGLALQLGPVDYFLLRGHRQDPARRAEVAADLLIKSGRGIAGVAGAPGLPAAQKAMSAGDAGFREQRLPELQALGIV
jgi:SAM-dependent methyltransferase